MEHLLSLVTVLLDRVHNDCQVAGCPRVLWVDLEALFQHHLCLCTRRAVCRETHLRKHVVPPFNICGKHSLEHNPLGQIRVKEEQAVILKYSGRHRLLIPYLLWPVRVKEEQAIVIEAGVVIRLHLKGLLVHGLGRDQVLQIYHVFSIPCL